jgi:hypothetical protein
MTKVTLDTTASDQLTNVVGSAQVFDEHGQLLGYFYSRNRKPGQLPPGFEIPLSIEETEKLRGGGTGRTLDEILQGMGLR